MGRTDLILTASDGTKYDVDIRKDGTLVTTFTKTPHNTHSEQSVKDSLSKSVFYEGITYKRLRDDTSETDYYITHIPNKDKNGNLIKVKHGYANDVPSLKVNGEIGETVSSFSDRKKASFVANASIWDVDDANKTLLGVQIKDGVIMTPTKPQDIAGNPTTNTLGIRADNSFVVYDYMTTTPQQMIANGVVNAFTGFWPIITNSKKAQTDWAVHNYPYITDQRHPRNVIAQMPNLDIIFLTCDGRDDNNKGMTFDDLARILLNLGVKSAFCLDGGGSSSTVVRNIKVNPRYDGAGRTERKVGDFIYFSTEIENDNTMNVLTMSDEYEKLNKAIQDIRRDVYDLNLGSFNQRVVASRDQFLTPNFNSPRKSGRYYASKADNSPSPFDDSIIQYFWLNYYAVSHHQINPAKALQFAVPYDRTIGKSMMRVTQGSMDVWSNWRTI